VFSRSVEGLAWGGHLITLRKKAILLGRMRWPLFVVSSRLAVVTRVNFAGSGARCMTVSIGGRTRCSI
jgi:hypothetical protein